MAAVESATGVMAIVMAVSLAGCATAPPPRAPAPTAAAAPAAAAAPGLRLQPIPFPPGTFTGEVAALDAPVVAVRGDLLAIGFSLGGVSPVECLLSRADIGAGGSTAALAALGRGRFALEGPSPTDVTMRPPLPALFLAVRRPLGLMKLASYRHGPNLALLCVQQGPAPPETFDEVVAALATSLRAVGPAPERASQVWSCGMRTDEGSSGWGRMEVSGRDGPTTVQITAAVAYHVDAGIVIVEVDEREESDAHGRVVAATLTRSLNRKIDLRSRLTRVAGATYHYDVTRWDNQTSGTFSATDADGLLGISGIAARLRDELLSGRVPELRIETYAAVKSPDAPTLRSYRIETPGTRNVLITDATGQMHDVLDENGFTVGSEYELDTGDTLYETCRPERPRR
jgi:hypothetical protein